MLRNFYQDLNLIIKVYLKRAVPSNSGARLSIMTVSRKRLLVMGDNTLYNFKKRSAFYNSKSVKCAMTSILVSI